MSARALADEQATEALGSELGKALLECAHAGESAPLTVFLHGSLGAGKTTLVRGLLRALGYTGDVTSPTYSIYEEYQLAGLRCLHCDFYRLDDEQEIDYLGLRDLFGPRTVLLVEWPSIATGHLPPPDLEIALGYAGRAREVRLAARSAAGERWLANGAWSGAAQHARADPSGESLM